ncbi:hypothetical protein COO60DRAFT_926734 [Scenedesmus sp. NREL 46B-D3]|nr:hypothetical protein COO60DRAFT_926734 [Scenedesmus sp. NREL 46B-D3]
MNNFAESLHRFCDHLQEWDELVASGAAALAVLQQAFVDLQPVSGSKTTPRILEKLSELAPSFCLDDYLSDLRQGTTSSSDPQLAGGMHAAFTALQDAVLAAKQQLESMQQLAKDSAEAALARPLQVEQEVATGLHGLCLQADEEQQQQQHTPGQEQEQQGRPTPAAAAAVLSSSGEEIALLLSGVVAGLQRDMEWMELAVGRVSLDSSPDDLSTISTLWQLQPFTDEAAVAAVWDAAAAAIADAATS